MSIEENITLQPEKEIDRDRLDKVLELSGLMDKIKSLPEGVKTPLVKTILENAVELSGGELQKLLLARALEKTPEEEKILLVKRNRERFTV